MSYTATLLFTNAKSWSAKLAVRWLKDGLSRSQLEAAEEDVAVRERLDHAAVLADADPELPERERVIAEAVHQHFLEPVPQRLLLLDRAAERELRLHARRRPFW